MMSAMQADRVQTFNYRKELYSDLGSPILAERQNLFGNNARKTRYSFDIQFESDDASYDINHKKRSSLRRAASFGNQFSRRLAKDFKSAISKYDDTVKEKVIPCCDKQPISDCAQAAFNHFIPIFIKTGLAKLLLTLLSTRSVTKTFEALKFEIPRFGSTFGIVGALFHIAICLLRRLGKRQGKKWPYQLSEKQSYMMAAFLSTIPLTFGLQANELNLAKLMFFPLAFRCVCDKLLEIGVLPKLQAGDIISYMLVCFAVTFAYILEGHSVNHSVHKMIDSYCG